jgi:peptidoglycan/LPS O-acetylase OafA/YrhL
VTTPNPNRLHGLDTLRALAIVSVIIFHLQPFLPAALDPIKRTGWMGVDLFFVLSGFLIGSQLLKPFPRNQPPKLRAFYIRRAYRILPAYLAVLLLYFTISQWREHERLPSAWKLLTFTANLRMNYPAELAFSHVWSLCVEEHFYLLLPWLILWLMRKPAAWKPTAFIAAMFLFGIAVRSWELFHVVRAPGLSDDQASALFMKRIYYPTYTRLDGLVSGATLATIRIFRPAWWARLAHRGNALLLAGLLLSGAAIWTFRGTTRPPIERQPYCLASRCSPWASPCW